MKKKFLVAAWAAGLLLIGANLYLGALSGDYRQDVIGHVGSTAIVAESHSNGLYAIHLAHD